ncbi:hypothetical protein [Bacillus sp. Marseille-P3800]|uniref:hypothetical protein n=1 Tax=Bacillus sp. Marseille-P3800 TaxID=2014782 RepID=UPI000C07C993|nr:hypothetical protein [Bacillus sp. Marseille-P3800]
MSNKGFTSLSQVFAHINQSLAQSIQDEDSQVVKASIETLKQSVQENVYDVYSPFLYDRTGGLKEEWKVEIEDGGIAIMSNRHDGETYVAEVVETGTGYRYDFPYNGVPRPFTQLAAEELKGNGRLSHALKQDLVKRGFRIV